MISTHEINFSIIWLEADQCYLFWWLTLVQPIHPEILPTGLTFFLCLANKWLKIDPKMCIRHCTDSSETFPFSSFLKDTLKCKSAVLVIIKVYIANLPDLFQALVFRCPKSKLMVLNKPDNFVDKMSSNQNNYMNSILPNWLGIYVTVNRWN